MTQEEMLSQMNSMLQPLQRVNAPKAETIIRLTRQNESLQNRLNELTAQVAWLDRQLFGHKSENSRLLIPTGLTCSVTVFLIMRLNWKKRVKQRYRQSQGER